MQSLPIKTRTLCPPKDNLFEALDEVLPPLQEKDILVITSKVVSIDEGRCISFDHVSDKDALIEKEADFSLPRDSVPNRMAVLTLKHHMLIPSAGIDESNSDGYYVLLPSDPFVSAKKIWEHYRQRFGLKEFGVIITDSTSHPLRYGVVSMSLSFWGINPLRDYRGQKDLFDRQFAMSQTNIPDSVSAWAGFLMGEGAESTPAVLLRDVPGIEFTTQDYSQSFLIPTEQDLFYPLLKIFHDKQ